MSVSTPPVAPVREGLGMLLDQLSRDGWLVGLNADADPALDRMDPGTGVYNRAYLHELTHEAIADARENRARLLDGPDTGSVALISIRVLNWVNVVPEDASETRIRIATEVARRLAYCLRAEDALGRVREDTFTLLLRGCPVAELASIARRCAHNVREVPAVTTLGPIPLLVGIATTRWDGETPEELVRRAAADIAGAASVAV